jgi:branched-chain amino acid transport system substrate-binding protein
MTVFEDNEIGNDEPSEGGFTMMTNKWRHRCRHPGAGRGGAGGRLSRKIGATLSLTGSYSTFGPPISNAAQLAVEQIAEAGWKVGNCTKLEYLVRDDQTQPSVGVDAARRLIDLDGVGAMVGPISSGVTGPILSSVTVERGVLVIRRRRVTDLHGTRQAGQDQGFAFRTQPSDASAGSRAAKLAIDGLQENGDRQPQQRLGQQPLEAVRRHYKALGGTVTGHVTYNAEQASYRAEVNKALQGDPESLYLAATPIDGSKIMRDWLAVGGARNTSFRSAE